MFSYLRSAWQLDETERLRQGSDKQNLRSEMRPRVARTLLSAPAQRQPPAHCRLTPLGFLPDSTRRNPPNPRTSVAADTPARACVAAGALACRPAHCRLAPLGFLPDSTRRNPPDPRTSVAADTPARACVAAGALACRAGALPARSTWLPPRFHPKKSARSANFRGRYRADETRIATTINAASAILAISEKVPVNG